MHYQRRWCRQIHSAHLSIWTITWISLASPAIYQVLVDGISVDRNLIMSTDMVGWRALFRTIITPKHPTTSHSFRALEIDELRKQYLAFPINCVIDTDSPEASTVGGGRRIDYLLYREDTVSQEVTTVSMVTSTMLPKPCMHWIMFVPSLENIKF